MEIDILFWNMAKYSEKRVAQLFLDNKIGGGNKQMIDLYHMTETREYAPTILTNINTCNHYYILEYGR